MLDNIGLILEILGKVGHQLISIFDHVDIFSYNPNN